MTTCARSQLQCRIRQMPLPAFGPLPMAWLFIHFFLHLSSPLIQKDTSCLLFDIKILLFDSSQPPNNRNKPRNIAKTRNIYQFVLKFDPGMKPKTVIQGYHWENQKAPTLQNFHCDQSEQESFSTHLQWKATSFYHKSNKVKSRVQLPRIIISTMKSQLLLHIR